MKKLVFASVLFIITATLFSSCKKSDDNTPSVTNKVKTYKEDVSSVITGQTSETYNFNYDASNRITGIISTTTTTHKFLFTYLSNNTFITDIYADDSEVLHITTFRNSKSLIDSTVQYTIGDEENVSKAKYIYNSASQIINLYEYDLHTNSATTLYNATTYTYNTAGDLIKLVDNEYEVNYEYYTDNLYVLPVVFDQGLTTAPQHLIKKQTVTTRGNIVTINHTYTFDSAGRISENSIVSSDGTIAKKTYTYF